jgi:hypothetical protein
MTTDLAPYLRWYVEVAHWRIVPILPGEKRPALSDWPNQAAGTVIEADWLWQVHPGAGIGVVTGSISGIFVLDVDVGPEKRGDETLAVLIEHFGPLPETWMVQTGSGGWHLYFRLPSGVVIRNDAGKRLGPGLDIRGEGGQVLAPPTIHPNGNPYVWEAEHEPGHVPLADAPEWLVTLLTHDDNDRPVRQAIPRREGELLPGDIFASEHTWPELLEAAGAHFIRSVNGVEYWARPGVDHVSASLYYGGSDVLKVFSSNWSPLTQEETYTRFGFYAALEWEGNHDAAALHLGYEQRQRRSDQWESELEEQPSPSVVRVTVAYAEWEDPVLLTVQRKPPSFNLNWHCSWMAANCRAVTIATQTPPDLSACLGLGVLSAACGGRVVVEVNPSWREPVVVWPTVVLASGARKSSTFAMMARPLVLAEHSLADSATAARTEAQSTKRLAQQARDLAEKEAVRLQGDEADEARRKAIELGMVAEQVVVPVVPRLLADDVTTEALGSLMAEQGGRIAVMSPEGDIFDLMAGRYSTMVNFGLYLKGHAGDMVRVDRKGRSSEYIEHPALTMCLAVQPHVLQAIGTIRSFRGRGLLARLLYSIPENTVGRRETVTPSVPDPIRLRYEANVSDLVTTMAGWTDPAVLTLTTEARGALMDYASALEPKLAGELDWLCDWASKLCGAIARIAGLLHMADNVPVGYRTPIGLEPMTKAMTMGDYFLGHAKVAFAAMNGPVGDPDANAILEWIEKTGATEFTKREVQRAHQGRFPRVEPIDEALELLEQRGWIRPKTVERPRGRGRPIMAYEAWPGLWDANAGKRVTQDSDTNDINPLQ